MHLPNYRAGCFATVAALAVSGCSHVGRSPPPGPPDLGLEPTALLRTWSEAQPRQAKLRHQVAIAVHGREQVVQGVVLLQRPDRFWVRAMTPLGAALFDVAQRIGETPRVTAHARELPDEQVAYHLARDIQRAYLDSCPADAAARRNGRAVEVRCALDGSGGDDTLEMDLTLGGVLWRKRFLRDGVVTAYVDYDAYRDIGGHLWAGRVRLRRTEAPYTLTIALVDADASFDAAAALDRMPP